MSDIYVQQYGRANRMKECWINVYLFPSGRTWSGQYSYSYKESESMAQQAIRNGSELIYRIHVRMK